MTTSSRLLWSTLCLAVACGGTEEDALADGADVLSVFEGVDATEYAKADAFEDNVELKVTVRADQRAKAEKSFKLTDAKATRRDVWFYDTRTLAHSKAGLILRARKTKNGKDDSTVKFRPLTAAEVDSDWFRVDGFKCEEDRVGTRAVQSCSLTVVQAEGEIDDVGDGDREVVKLFSGDQEDFAAERRTVDWGTLRPLGPTPTFVWKVSVAGFDPTITAERWELPDGTKLLELSAKVPRAQAARVSAAFDKLLAKRGLDTATKQETKTQVTLDYWSKH